MKLITIKSNNEITYINPNHIVSLTSYKEGSTEVTTITGIYHATEDLNEIVNRVAIALKENK